MATVEVKVDHHFTSKVYTSGSNIIGHAFIISDRDLPFDDIDIDFVGVAQKRLELSQLYLGNFSDAIFLKQKMPIDRTCLPQSKVLKAGEEYRVPFNFVVPRTLPNDVCRHPGPDALHDKHRQLPPTMGFWDGDNMCSDVTTIGYYVNAGIFQKTCPETRRRKLGGGKVNLRILPTTPEDPPLAITKADDQFAMSVTDKTRKLLNRRVKEKLDITAHQPRAIMLSPNGRQAKGATVRLSLEYATCDNDVKLPKPKITSAKIISNTYYGPKSLCCWANLGSRKSKEFDPILNYAVAIALDHTEIKPRWRRTSSDRLSKTVSPATTACGGLNDPEYEGRVSPVAALYAADVEIPFTIPQGEKAFFIPTFHSCHFSRTYTLQLNISSGLGLNSIKLMIPVQIGVEADKSVASPYHEYFTGEQFDQSHTDSLPSYGE